jgi:hypothetical protein
VTETARSRQPGAAQTASRAVRARLDPGPGPHRDNIYGGTVTWAASTPVRKKRAGSKGRSATKKMNRQDSWLREGRIARMGSFSLRAVSYRLLL